MESALAVHTNGRAFFALWWLTNSSIFSPSSFVLRNDPLRIAC